MNHRKLLAVIALLLLLPVCASAATFITDDDTDSVLSSRTSNSGLRLTTALEFVQGKFYGGQKLPLYTGPGTEYYRTGGGYAKVNTDEPIYVAGQEGSWALVMDAVYDGTAYRVGYVDLSQLKYDISFTGLNFAYTRASITRNCRMTNMPRGAGDDIVAFAAGEQVTYLCAYSAQRDWAYVEAVVDGVPVRGFVPADCIQQ